LGLFDLVFKNCFLVFENLKTKNLFERHIFKNYFAKLFPIFQFLKLKNQNSLEMFWLLISVFTFQKAKKKTHGKQCKFSLMAYW
jgi:hypothetical protein